MKRSIGLVAVFGIVVLTLVGGAGAAPVELITNGGFETGNFNGWTVVDQPGGTGSFFVTAVPVTPISLLPTVGPASATFYALSDQPGPGTHTLLQTISVPVSLQVLLTFDMFVNDQNGLGPIINPAGLNYLAVPNQHGRVDLLTGVAPPFDTGAGVLATFYLGVDPGVNPNPYTPYLFDITSLVGGGGTYQLRFAEVDNQWFFNMGVDNVSVKAEPVPEPATMLLLGGVLAGAAAYRRRRRCA